MHTTPRNLARQTGATRYVQGTPCSRGHVGERYTATGNCVECARGGSDRYAYQSGQRVNVTVSVHPSQVATVMQMVDTLNDVFPIVPPVPPVPAAARAPRVRQPKAVPESMTLADIQAWRLERFPELRSLSQAELDALPAPVMR